MKLFVPLVSSLVFLLGASAFKIERCSDFQGVGLLTLDQLSFSPDPIVIGRNVTTQLVGTLFQDIEETVEISGKMRFLFLTIPIPKKSICTYLDACPISKGALNITHTEMMKNDIPSGTYMGIVNLKKGDDHLDCFNVEIDVVHEP